MKTWRCHPFVEGYLSISKMAELHQISRQTLIYYDKIGIFKPVYIDDKGYRHYSPNQIPYLREICFLKSLGVRLEEIKENIENRDLHSVISLLRDQKDKIDKEIRNLHITREFLQQKLTIYSKIEEFEENLYKPYIQEFLIREVVFVPFEKELNKQELHFTLMKAWNIILSHDLLPSKGFGSIIWKNGLEENQLYKGAGSFVALPYTGLRVENKIILPSGDYVCMYKYGMPYEEKHIYTLIEWIHENNYEITGDIIDYCLLDTTFYGDKNSVDLCQIQIPIKKKGE